MKLMPGYKAISFFHGNVHKKPLARILATCSWLKLIDLHVPLFNKGILPGINSGNLNAKRIIPGKTDEKKCSLSYSSKTYKIQLH